MNKNDIVFISAIIAVLIMAAGVYIISNQSTDDGHIETNDGLLSITEFNISDKSKTESFADGTFFVSEKDNKLHIKMVMDVFVEENDKGGVSVYFPYGLTITEIFSSINGDISNNYADVWENPGHDSKEFYHFIEIARSLFRPNPSGGGSGMIIVEYSADKSITKNNVDSLDFLISLGTNESEHASTGIVRETVSVPLSKAA